MTNDQGDLRARLRSATSSAHQRLESSLDLLAEPADRARFIRLLEGFRSFHFAWEPALEHCLADDVPMLKARSKLSLIDDDLRALGRSDGEIEAHRDAPFATTLCIDVPTALGSFYVLEGSTLGGKFISRHLARAAAAWLPPAGLRYFDPYREATGARWKETVARLERAPRSDWERMEQGAVRTFEALDAWLDPPSTDPASAVARTDEASTPTRTTAA